MKKSSKETPGAGTPKPKRSSRKKAEAAASPSGAEISAETPSLLVAAGDTAGEARFVDREVPVSQPSAERAEEVEVPYDMVSRRAYEIYIQRGAAPGRELADWLEAERDVKHNRSRDVRGTTNARQPQPDAGASPSR